MQYNSVSSSIRVARTSLLTPFNRTMFKITTQESLTECAEEANGLDLACKQDHNAIKHSWVATEQ